MLVGTGQFPVGLPSSLHGLSISPTGGCAPPLRSSMYIDTYPPRCQNHISTSAQHLATCDPRLVARGAHSLAVWPGGSGGSRGILTLPRDFLFVRTVIWRAATRVGGTIIGNGALQYRGRRSSVSRILVEHQSWLVPRFSSPHMNLSVQASRRPAGERHPPPCIRPIHVGCRELKFGSGQRAAARE